MRLLGTLVFVLAVAGATLAGSGLVVTPHVDPPGTPVVHDHVLAAYRFPIFLMVLQQRAEGHRSVLTAATPLVQTAAFVMGLLVFLLPRLPRPTRRSLGHVAVPRLAPAQWRALVVTGPPRSLALLSN